MPRPVGERQVVPTTRFNESRDSCMARPRIGDLGGRDRNGELEGVSFSRLWEGVTVAAISSPLTPQRVTRTRTAGRFVIAGFRGLIERTGDGTMSGGLELGQTRGGNKELCGTSTDDSRSKGSSTEKCSVLINAGEERYHYRPQPRFTSLQKDDV